MSITDGSAAQMGGIWANRISRWMQRLSPSETQVLVASGLIVGIGAGIGAVIFRYLIRGFDYFFFDMVRPALAAFMGDYAVILIPALGGAIFGPIIYFFAREAKGHGVPEVMLAVALRGGKIRPQVAVVKSLASALCIGSGGSVGREGPIVQVGSALGSTFGQLTRMSDDRIRTLVACGAAGGIAATFNAPIAGVFFALEVILDEFTTRAFGVVVIASVAASVIGRAAFGNSASFPVPTYALESLFELPLYALLSILAGLVGVAFTRTLYWFEDRADAIPLLEYVKPIPGGLMVGALGLFLPEIFGTGYPAMENSLAGNFGLWLLLGLAVAKILAVSITIGSGGSGGVFAPSLFIGAMLGTAFGTIVDALMPNITAPPGAYGLVGMAAVFSGAARAPMTSVIILFELTGDYKIILPLMGSVVISTLISEKFSKDTIYTLKLRRRGIDIRAGKDVDLMRSIHAYEAMTTEVPVAAADLSVAEASELLSQKREPALLIVDEANELEGIVTVSDVQSAMLDNRPGIPLGEIASRPVVTTFPNDTLAEAIRKMGVRDIRQLPVVRRSNPRRILGLLRRDDIVRAYSRAVLERVESERKRPVQPSELRGTQMVEVTVGPNSPLASATLDQVALPPDALMIAIEREGRTIIPRGGTDLQPDDRLLILVRQEKIADLHEHLAAVPRTTNST